MEPTIDIARKAINVSRNKAEKLRVYCTTLQILSSSLGCT